MTEAKKLLQIPFLILGKEWKLRVLTEKYFKKKNGNSAAAVTKVHKRRIELRSKFIDQETITHEVVHAFAYEMCLHSTFEMSANDWEEFFCELIAKRGEEILSLSKSLHTQIQSVIQM